MGELKSQGVFQCLKFGIVESFSYSMLAWSRIDDETKNLNEYMALNCNNPICGRFTWFPRSPEFHRKQLHAIFTILPYAKHHEDSAAGCSQYHRLYCKLTETDRATGFPIAVAS